MNSVNLIGRLVANPEQHQAGQTLITSFTVAVKSRFKDKATGEYKTDFIRCKAFSKTAEIIAQNFSKGSLIGLEGSIQTGSYDKDGVKVYTTDVIVQRVTFLEKKEQGGQYANQVTQAQYQPTGQGMVQPQQQYNQAPQFQQPQPTIDISDEDLPF